MYGFFLLIGDISCLGGRNEKSEDDISIVSIRAPSRLLTVSQKSQVVPAFINARCSDKMRMAEHRLSARKSSIEHGVGSRQQPTDSVVFWLPAFVLPPLNSGNYLAASQLTCI